MIDFSKAGVIKLQLTDNKDCSSTVANILVEGEEVIYTFKTVRDNVVFTNLRIIGINVQGTTGKKRDVTSLPLKNVQAFSVESAAVLATKCSMELWFAGLGQVKLEFDAKTDVYRLTKVIGYRAL